MTRGRGNGEGAGEGAGMTGEGAGMVGEGAGMVGEVRWGRRAELAPAVEWAIDAHRDSFMPLTIAAGVECGA